MKHYSSTVKPNCIVNTAMCGRDRSISDSKNDFRFWTSCSMLDLLVVHWSDCKWLMLNSFTLMFFQCVYNGLIYYQYKQTATAAAAIPSNVLAYTILISVAIPFEIAIIVPFFLDAMDFFKWLHWYVLHTIALSHQEARARSNSQAMSIFTHWNGCLITFSHYCFRIHMHLRVYR